MSMWFRTFAGGLLAGALTLGAPLAMAADAANGLRLATRWCSSCHLVAGGQPSASADVPAFSAIAAKQDFSAEKVALFLLDPHPKMPDFTLSRTEAADLAAYIASLRK